MENIEIILNKIITGTYNWDELDKLSYGKKEILSEKYARWQLNKTLETLDNDSRNFFKTEINPHICGVEGESRYLASYLVIIPKEKTIKISFYGDSGSESFKTKEKINGFIEALIQARDSAFPE